MIKLILMQNTKLDVNTNLVINATDLNTGATITANGTIDMAVNGLMNTGTINTTELSIAAEETVTNSGELTG